MQAPEPNYLQFSPEYLSGVADQLDAHLHECRLCPNRCGVDRTAGKVGLCRATDTVKLGNFAVHHGEEPPLSGTRGSGTVFFSHCTLQCLFCQNYPLSQLHHGKEYTIEMLSDAYLWLQHQGCHNINWVSATQFLPQAFRALLLAKAKGFRLPIVYNSSGWETEETVQLLRPMVDIYLPDARYANEKPAIEYSKAFSYPEINEKALRFMHEIQPEQVWHEDGTLQKGMIVRVLILPGHAEDAVEILTRLKAWFGVSIPISLMSQYFPCYKALEHPVLNRRLLREEYDLAVNALHTLGFENGWVQEFDA